MNGVVFIMKTRFKILVIISAIIIGIGTAETLRNLAGRETYTQYTEMMGIGHPTPSFNDTWLPYTRRPQSAIQIRSLINVTNASNARNDKIVEIVVALEAGFEIEQEYDSNSGRKRYIFVSQPSSEQRYNVEITRFGDREIVEQITIELHQQRNATSEQWQ